MHISDVKPEYFVKDRVIQLYEKDITRQIQDFFAFRCPKLANDFSNTHYPLRTMHYRVNGIPSLANVNVKQGQKNVKYFRNFSIRLGRTSNVCL